MKSVLSRIFASLDRISAPLAFAVMAGAGGFEAFALLHGDHAASTVWYVRAAPFVAFGSMLIVAVFLIASSRPTVMRRPSTTRQDQYSSHLQDFGRLITFHASFAIFLVVPALILSGKFSENKQAESEIKSAEPAASAATSQPPSSASVAPGPIPSAAAAPSVPLAQPSSTPAPATSFQPTSTRNPQPSAVPTTRSSPTVSNKPAFRAPGAKPALAPDDLP